MQDTIHDTIQDTEILKAVESLFRKLHFMYQAWIWSRAARKAINNRRFDSAQIAIRKFDELNEIIKGGYDHE